MPIEAPKAAFDFIKEHWKAQELTIDYETGLPVCATYSGADSTGNLRRVPAVYYFRA